MPDIDDPRTVPVVLLSGFVPVGLLSVTTDTGTLLVVTPLGVATLPLVGVTLPQLLARRDGSAVRRGFGALATVAAGVVLAFRIPAFLADGVPAALLSLVSGWFVGLLALVVVCVYSALAVREGLSGYRATRG